MIQNMVNEMFRYIYLAKHLTNFKLSRLLPKSENLEMSYTHRNYIIFLCQFIPYVPYLYKERIINQICLKKGKEIHHG